VLASCFGIAFFAHAQLAGAAANPNMLAPEKIVLKSAHDVNVKDHTAILPLHRGTFEGKTVWYVMTDASDFGIARDLDVLYAPKLANMAIGCPDCVQEVTLAAKSDNKFAEATVQFAGVPDFSPTRVFQPSATGFPPAVAKPGGVGDAHYSPFVRIKGSNVVYNMPIVATGDGPFDAVHHSNTQDHVLAIDLKEHQDGPEVTMLLAPGFDAGQPILYLSTEASLPDVATIERATYVPLLAKAPFLGGDDFAGSARERIFALVNGQTGKDNPQAQGFVDVALDENLNLDATLANASTIETSRNVQGDFPTQGDPRHANAYSPLWDAQVGQWTQRAIDEHRNVRQTDENEILNLAAEGYITGPMGAPFGSAGFVINCPPVAYLDREPVQDLTTSGYQQGQ
jgi:hypothetical protein